MPKPKPDLEDKITLAALRLIAGHGWKALTLDAVARAAKIPAAAVRKIFATTYDILPAIVHVVTRQTETALGKPDSRASSHDRLFEVMMTRFDVLQKHRKAVLVLMAAARGDSKMMYALAQAQGRAMQDMLALAGLSLSAGPRQQGLAAAAGLGPVYHATLWVWRNDETLDMAKTMAALDRYLRWAGRVAEILF